MDQLMKLNNRYFKCLLFFFSILVLFVVTCSFPKKRAFAADLPSIPPKTHQYFSEIINQLKDAGLIDFAINPEGGPAQVYVATRCWEPMLPEDKATFVEMFLGFFHGYNQDHPGSGEVTSFTLLNLNTQKPLARAWLKSPPNPNRRIEIFQ